MDAPSWDSQGHEVLTAIRFQHDGRIANAEVVKTDVVLVNGRQISQGMQVLSVGDLKKNSFAEGLSRPRPTLNNRRSRSLIPDTIEMGVNWPGSVSTLKEAAHFRVCEH
jgi:hypothetical protein